MGYQACRKCGALRKHGDYVGNKGEHVPACTKCGDPEYFESSEPVTTWVPCAFKDAGGGRCRGIAEKDSDFCSGHTTEILEKGKITKISYDVLPGQGVTKDETVTFVKPSDGTASPHEAGVKALEDMGVTGPGKALGKYRERKIADESMIEIRDDPFTFEDLKALYSQLLEDPARPNVLVVPSTPSGTPNPFAAAVRKQLEAKGWRMEINPETGFLEINAPEGRQS